MSLLGISLPQRLLLSALPLLGAAQPLPEALALDQARRSVVNHANLSELTVAASGRSGVSVSTPANVSSPDKARLIRRAERSTEPTRGVLGDISMNKSGTEVHSAIRREMPAGHAVTMKIDDKTEHSSSIRRERRLDHAAHDAHEPRGATASMHISSSGDVKVHSNGNDGILDEAQKPRGDSARVQVASASGLTTRRIRSSGHVASVLTFGAVAGEGGVNMNIISIVFILGAVSLCAGGLVVRKEKIKGIGGGGGGCAPAAGGGGGGAGIGGGAPAAATKAEAVVKEEKESDGADLVVFG